jgi:hypothetical protein
MISTCLILVGLLITQTNKSSFIEYYELWFFFFYQCLQENQECCHSCPYLRLLYFTQLLWFQASLCYHIFCCRRTRGRGAVVCYMVLEPVMCRCKQWADGAASMKETEKSPLLNPSTWLLYCYTCHVSRAIAFVPNKDSHCFWEQPWLNFVPTDSLNLKNNP